MNPFNHKLGYYQNETNINEIDFIIWSPTQKNISLKILTPEPMLYPMTMDEWGYWKTTIPVVPAGTRYVYILEDGSECIDPASVSQPEGVHYPSELIDRNFDWTDHSWKGLAMEEMIIYELHTGTFTLAGTFKGIQERLDYLVDLGINTIEIMPIAQFSGNHNWGYDGVFVFAAQNSYGTAKDLKSLINEAHKRGIAVLLDVVYNHTGPEGSCLKKLTPHYFNEKYHNNWADALNFDGPYSNGVRNYFIQNALMWLNEFRMDGLRMDAVHAIYDNSALHFMKELKEAVAELEKKSGRKKILIAEFDLNDPRFVNSTEKGGYAIDGQWVDEFHHALHSVYIFDLINRELFIFLFLFEIR